LARVPAVIYPITTLEEHYYQCLRFVENLHPNFAIGGWIGYANQHYIGRGDADVWNWAVTLAFPIWAKKEIWEAS